MKKISFLIPCYNEEKTIKKAIDKIVRLNISSKEIIIIDNGSTDKSQSIIKKYKNKKNIKIILRKNNQGYGSSIKQAAKLSNSKYLFIHFSDNEYDHTTSLKMYNLAEKNKLDAVFGSRLKGLKLFNKLFLLQKKPSYLGTFMITGLYNILYNKKFTDVIGSKFYKVSTLRKISKIKDNHFNFDFILKNRLISKNFNIEEVFTKYRPRYKGKHVKFYHIFPALYQIIKYKINSSS